MTSESVAGIDAVEAGCENCAHGKSAYFDGMYVLFCAKREDLFSSGREPYGKEIRDCWQWNRRDVVCDPPESHHRSGGDEDKARCWNCLHHHSDEKAGVGFCDIYECVNPHDSLYTPIGTGDVDDCEEHEYEDQFMPAWAVAECAE